MLTQFTSVIVALLVFSFIVFIHELGHFYFARRGGIAVARFAVGMGPKLIGKKINGTEWTINLLPIGGYCYMLGEDGSEEKIEIPEDLPGGLFTDKSVWVRIKAVFGGPLFNFILAFVFAIILMSLSDISTNEIGIVGEGTPAEEAGLMVGDKLVEIDGEKLFRPREASIYINVAEGDPVDVVVERTYDDGSSEELIFTIQPAMIESDPNVAPEDSPDYFYIGIGYGQADKNVWSVVKYGALETASWIKVVFYSLGKLFTGKVALNSLSGPVGLVSTIGKDYEASLAEGIKVVISQLSFWIVLISANLGIMNLLPIPALDGGRLVFLLGEVITGKPIAPNKEGFIHLIGFALLMLLMVFIMYNDILRVFGLG